MNTGAIQALLRQKYSSPEYAFLSEVRNGTGFARPVRTADALAFSLWPSRGLEMLGFEIKVARSDWLRELKQPAKADAIAVYCDRWFIVAGEGVVADGELPRTWGLILATEKGLRVKVSAPLNESVRPMDRLMMCSVMKEYGGLADEALVAIRNEERKKAEEAARASTEAHCQHLEKRLREVRGQIDEFERMAGVRLTGWNYGHIAQAVEFVRSGGVSGIERDLQNLKARAEEILGRISAVLDEASRPLLTQENS